MHSMRALSLAISAVLLSLVCLGQARNLAPAIVPNSPIVQESSLVVRDCKEGDWGLLDNAEARNLLSDYDFDPFTPGRCAAVDVKWLPSAQIVRLSGITTRVDDFHEITLLRASPASRIWLIPLMNGMVGDSDTPSNPHHLAAFNDLLRVAQLKITDKNLFDISDLYQFVVGMQVKPSPRSTGTSRDAMSVNETSSLIERNGDFTDFTRREPFGDSWSFEYIVWEFRYLTSGKFGRLIDVERKTLKQYEGDK